MQKNKKMTNPCTVPHCMHSLSRTPSWVTELVIRISWVYGKSPGSLTVGPRCHECDNNLILLLKFACNTDLGPKQLVAAKLARSANYASSTFYGKSMKSMLVLTDYVKHYASTIYQSLLQWFQRLQCKDFIPTVGSSRNGCVDLYPSLRIKNCNILDVVK